MWKQGIQDKSLDQWAHKSFRCTLVKSESFQHPFGIARRFHPDGYRIPAPVCPNPHQRATERPASARNCSDSQAGRQSRQTQPTRRASPALPDSTAAIRKLAKQISAKLRPEHLHYGTTRQLGDTIDRSQLKPKHKIKASELQDAVFKATGIKLSAEHLQKLAGRELAASLQSGGTINAKAFYIQINKLAERDVNDSEATALPDSSGLITTRLREDAQRLHSRSSLRSAGVISTTDPDFQSPRTFRRQKPKESGRVPWQYTTATEVKGKTQYIGVSPQFAGVCIKDAGGRLVIRGSDGQIIR